jgi:hypothetical protein
MVIIDLSKRVMMTANVTLTDRVVYVVKKFTAINRQAQVCACTVLQAQVCSCTELTITGEPLAGSTFGTIRYLSCSNERQNGLRPKRSKKIGA